ncbi:MAG: hypothetical protein QOC99_2167 [Acidobacteriota bacterium]|jgi:predicted nucleic acid-binding protein|nr:hypothetical protein [Acidobacteriota bacterium]
MLLDTSGLMCLFDLRDFRHADALTTDHHFEQAGLRRLLSQ